MEKNEEKKLAFLDRMSQRFLNEAYKDSYNSSDIIEMSFRLAHIMIKFAYMATMPDSMSEDAKEDAATNATLFTFAHHGKYHEKELRNRGLSYGEAKNMIKNGHAPVKKNETNEKANKGGKKNR